MEEKRRTEETRRIEIENDLYKDQLVGFDRPKFFQTT